MKISEAVQWKEYTIIWAHRGRYGPNVFSLLRHVTEEQ